MKIDFSTVTIQDEWVPSLETITDDLVEKGYSIIDSLLSPNDAKAIYQRLHVLKEEDEFKKSGIGKSIKNKIDPAIRGDYIRWIETDDLSMEIQPYYVFIKQLIRYLNQQLYLSIKDFEGHYTYYPTGKYYLKHRDRFKVNSHRVISIVFYLNPDWQKEDSGELIIYNDALEPIQTVAPLFNRMVIFKSELIHEVVPCGKPRNSVTTWLLDKEKELTFL